MAEGARRKGGVGKSYLKVRDRGEAIRQAVRMAREGDLVIACGKGHEQSMCFGNVEYPWMIAWPCAPRWLSFSATGPAMPYLPTQDEAPPDPSPF